MYIPEKLRYNVQHYFGEEGENWLSRLPQIIKQCEEHWNIVVGDPYSLSVNYVAPVVWKEQNREAVLKLSIPNEQYLQELEAITMLQEGSMASLLDYHRELGAMLLEKIIPGEALATIEDDEKGCFIASEVGKQLWIPVPVSMHVNPTNTREDELRDIVHKHPNGIGPIDYQTLEEAKETFTLLCKTSADLWVLHGDFHPYNILFSNKLGWCAIDPKGGIGEREYDLIQYILNKLPEDDAALESIIIRRMNSFTTQLSLRKDRLIGWGFCHSVLATVWTCKEDGDYDKSFYKGMRVFQQLWRETRGGHQ
ncbi:MAG: aminoglycoside phosphotransferase family protein [Myxosarcina sp. JB018]|nr:aminoglycoside phosphotransferase family protein [Myxosarcina sp. JB018]